MKLKIWPDDATVIEMNDWLAELREDGRTDPPAVAPVATTPVATTTPAEPAAPVAPTTPAEPVEPAAPTEPAASAAPVEPAEPVEPVAPTEPVAPPEPAAPAVRAVIGDQLRMPVAWCEMGGCISCHADPAALGEADARARAIDAGWCIDAFGRLACPRCQQSDPRYRACSPVVPWDRHTAMARAARIADARGGA